VKFLAYTIGDDSTPLPSPTPELFAEMGKFMAEAFASGVLLATGGVAPQEQGITVSYWDGKFSVVDGPYTEAKELVGGWALMKVDSREEAVDWAKRFLQINGGGESRLRQVFGPEDFEPGG